MCEQPSARSYLVGVVLRSERGAPELPHWRDGLTECLAAIAQQGS